MHHLYATADSLNDSKLIVKIEKMLKSQEMREIETSEIRYKGTCMQLKDIISIVRLILLKKRRYNISDDLCLNVNINYLYVFKHTVLRYQVTFDFENQSQHMYWNYY